MLKIIKNMLLIFLSFELSHNLRKKIIYFQYYDTPYAQETNIFIKYKLIKRILKHKGNIYYTIVDDVSSGCTFKNININLYDLKKLCIKQINNVQI